MTSILYVGNKLASKIHNVSAIDCLGPSLEGIGYNVTYASSKRNKVVRLMDMLWSCLKYRKQVDYVLIDTYSTLNFYYAFFTSQLCRVLKIKYIPILHGGNLSKRLKKNPLLCCLIFQHAYKIVAPSQYLKSEFEIKGFKPIYIPNSIEIQRYPYKERVCNEVNLLWVRSFSKMYNPQLAIKILKSLTDFGIKASLCMVGPDSGDGSLQASKHLAAQMQVEVKFTGKLTKQEWIALSKEYNVFINTTNFDNMPVSVIEAMALGLPVVSTNVGGMPNLIENEKEGILVNPNSEREFVEAIKTIRSNEPAIQTITQNARKKVEQFDWNTIKHQWAHVLQ